MLTSTNPHCRIACCYNHALVLACACSYKQAWLTLRLLLPQLQDDFLRSWDFDATQLQPEPPERTRWIWKRL